MDAIVVGPGEGEKIAVGPSVALIKASAEQTGGRFALIDSVYAPGFAGPLPHRHAEMRDCFYILEGTLRFQVGDDTIDAGAGSFVMVPPGLVHTFSNPHPEPARVLNLFSPGGLEAYLRELGALSGPPSPETMAELASRYDFEVADS